MLKKVSPLDSATVMVDKEDGEGVELLHLLPNSASSRLSISKHSPAPQPRQHRLRLWRQKCLYGWMIPLIDRSRLRHKRKGDGLSSKCLPALEKEDTSELADMNFSTHWNTQLNGRGRGGFSKRKRRRRQCRPASLTWALCKAFGQPLLCAAPLLLVQRILLLLSLIILSRWLTLLLEMEEGGRGGKIVLDCVLLCLLLGVCQATSAVLFRRYHFICQRVGMRVRAAITLAVQSKALRLRTIVLRAAAVPTSCPRVATQDPQIVADAIPHLNTIWASAFSIISVLLLIAIELGPIVSATIAASLVISGAALIWTNDMEIHEDHSNSNTHSVDNSMYSMNGGSRSRPRTQFQRNLRQLRSVLRTLSTSLWCSGPLIGTAFGLSFTSHEDWSWLQLLVSLALLRVLRDGLEPLPIAISKAHKAYAAIGRLQSLLLLKEMSPMGSAPLSGAGVAINKATFVWDRKETMTDDADSTAIELDFALAQLKEAELELEKYTSNQHKNNSTNCITANGARSPTGRTHTSSCNGTSNSPTSTVPVTPSISPSRSCVHKTHHRKSISWNSAEDSTRIVADGMELTLSPPPPPPYRVVPGSNGTHSDKSNLKSNGKVKQLHELPPRPGFGVGAARQQMLTQQIQAAVHVPAPAPIRHAAKQLPSPPRSSAHTPGGTPFFGPRLLALSRVSLFAGAGEFVGIVGPRGAGKSSMLAAILGEARKVGGRISVRGKIGYVGPAPFLRRASLRENVIFGLPYDAERYSEVLAAVSLPQSAANNTNTGSVFEDEFGSSGAWGNDNSTSNATRIALARALYSDADVLLLDDCVDECIDAVEALLWGTNGVGITSSTGNSSNIKSGTFGRKCVVMSTRRPHALLGNATLIIVLSATGRVQACGAYSELMATAKGKSLLDAASSDRSPTRNGTCTSFWSNGGDRSPTRSAMATLSPCNRARSRPHISKSPGPFVGDNTPQAVIALVFGGGSEVVSLACAWLGGSPPGAFITASICALVLDFGARMTIKTSLCGGGRRRGEEGAGRGVDLDIDLWPLCAVRSVVALIMMLTTSPPLAVAVLPIVLLCVWWIGAFLPTAKQVKALEEASRQKLHYHVAEVLQGAVPIRVAGAGPAAMEQSAAMLNLNQRARLVYYGAQAWISVRLELAAASLVLLAMLHGTLAGGINTDSSRGTGQRTLSSGVTVVFALALAGQCSAAARSEAERRWQLRQRLLTSNSSSPSSADPWGTCA